MVKKVLKYGTGQKIPKGAVYLCSKKNGLMKRWEGKKEGYKYVYHYFLVEVKDNENKS